MAKNMLSSLALKLRIQLSQVMYVYTALDRLRTTIAAWTESVVLNRGFC
jgi:hypothetical protein